MKGIQCRLIIHGIRRQFDMGEFGSISKAKTYAREVINRPYTIQRV